MAHKKVQCTLCGKIKKMSHVLFYKNLTIYKVSNVQELNKVYNCRECRRDSNRTDRLPIRCLPKYLRMLNDLRELSKEYNSRGIADPSVRKNFQLDVEKLLENEKILKTDYRVFIKNDVVIGFKVINIPIVGSVVFPLKKGIYEKCE